MRQDGVDAAKAIGNKAGNDSAKYASRIKNREPISICWDSIGVCEDVKVRKRRVKPKEDEGRTNDKGGVAALPESRKVHVANMPPAAITVGNERRQAGLHEEPREAEADQAQEADESHRPWKPNFIHQPANDNGEYDTTQR